MRWLVFILKSGSNPEDAPATTEQFTKNGGPPASSAPGAQFPNLGATYTCAAHCGGFHQTKI